MNPFERRYWFSPDVVIRTPLEEAQLAHDIYSAVDPVATVRDMLLARPGLQTALFVASPSLWREAEAWLGGGTLGRRAFSRIASYLVRAATRQTPFGFFAGLDVIDRTSGEPLRLAGAHRQRLTARADAEWLAMIVSELESDPARRLALPVIVGDGVRLDGDRYRTLDERGARPSASGYFAYCSGSFKATAAVRFILETARAPVTLHRLVHMVVERSGAPRAQAEEVLDGLWRAGAFVSLIRPIPFTDPLEHVVAVADAWQLDDPVFEPLRDFVRRLAVLNRQTPTTVPLSAIRDLSAAMNELVPNRGISMPIQLDVRRPARGGLPPAVVEAVGLLAEYALRVSPMLPPGDFRAAFAERFEGTTRRVPLLELLEPGAGIEAEPIPTPPRFAPSVQQRRLRDALDRCARDGRSELVLDPGDIDAFLPPLPPQRELPDSVEVSFEVFASSHEALEAGDFTVSVGGFGVLNGAGRGLARFLRILPEAVTDRLRAEWAGRAVEGLIDAELAFSPTMDRSLNVGAHPRLAPLAVTLGLPRANGDLGIGDIELAIADGALTAYDGRTGKPLDVRYPHMLSMRNATPAGRLLAHLRFDRERMFADHDIAGEDIRSAAYVPRVRIGRVIARKATWRLDVDRDSVDAALVTTAADALRVPIVGYLVERDHKLFFDRSSALGVAMIVREVQRTGSALIEEAIDGDSAWLTDGQAGFRAEFVARAYLRERYAAPAQKPSAGIAVRRTFPPGSAWTSLKLYVPRPDQDALLSRAVPSLIEELRTRGDLVGWFFIRYTDAKGPHVRLRLRVSSDGLGVLAVALRRTHEWADAGLARTIEAVTYEREIERYGGDYVEQAERFFERDSEDCVSILAIGGSRDERLRCGAAGALALGRAVLRDDEAFYRWALASSTQPQTLSPRLRTIVRQILGDGNSSAGIFDAVAATETSAPTTTSREAVADALIHMRCNRLGFDRAEEAAVRSVMRSVVVSLRACRTTELKWG